MNVRYLPYPLPPGSSASSEICLGTDMAIWHIRADRRQSIRGSTFERRNILYKMGSTASGTGSMIVRPTLP